MSLRIVLLILVSYFDAVTYVGFFLSFVMLVFELIIDSLRYLRVLCKLVKIKKKKLQFVVIAPLAR